MTYRGVDVDAGSVPRKELRYVPHGERRARPAGSAVRWHRPERCRGAAEYSPDGRPDPRRGQREVRRVARSGAGLLPARPRARDGVGTGPRAVRAREARTVAADRRWRRHAAGDDLEAELASASERATEPGCPQPGRRKPSPPVH